MSRKQRTSPWVWVAVGCGGAALLFVVVAGAFVFFSYRMGKRLQGEMEDPAAREAAVRRVLGSDELPAGYYPVMGFSIPMLMELAMLSDVEAPPGPVNEPRFDQRGFLYFAVFSTGKQRAEVKDFFAGKIDRTEFLRRSSVHLHRGEVLARGTVETGGLDVPYVAQRGALDFGAGARRHEGITTTVLVECPDSSRLRLGMWFGPDPHPEAAPGEEDLAGTTADPAALTAFLDHFRLCGGPAQSSP
jgi:hypothetical protein